MKKSDQIDLLFLCADPSGSGRIENLLSEAGYRVTLVNHQEQVEEIMVERLPDLFLTNCVMNSGTGPEVMAFLNGHIDADTIPKIVIGSELDPEASVTAYTSGATAFLPECCPAEILTGRVRDLVHIARGGNCRSELNDALGAVEALGRLLQADKLDETPNLDFSGEGIRVLIVEDSAVQAERLRCTLLKYEFEVTVARDGREGLEKAREIEPAVVLSDIIMPNMDGYELCRCMKQDCRFRETVFVMLTSMANPVDIVNGVNAGADYYLIKPCEEEKLVHRLREIIKRRRAFHPGDSQETLSVHVNGQHTLVRAGRRQLLDLMFATYQNAVDQNRELRRLQSDLRSMNANLENLVRERTVELVRHRTMLEEAEQVAHTGGWEWDFSSDLWRVSGEWAHMHGISDTELSRSEWIGLIHSEDVPTVESALSLVENNQTSRFDVDYRLAGYSSTDVRHMHSIGRLIRDDSGRTVRMYGIALDVTEKKKIERERLVMEAQLRKSQKLESLGTLAGGVAHEINNPLAVITGYSDLILKRNQADTITLDQIRIVREQADRVAMIVKNLLSFSRYDERRGHEFQEIGLIIGETLSLVKTVMCHDAIQIDVDIPVTLPRLHCHKQQLQQVLMNLLNNARDALNEKYTVPCPEKHIHISARTFCRNVLPADSPETSLNWLAITVEDKGSGLTEEVRQRMFDPFYTTKSCDKGTGLGLWISHEIMSKHKGHIQVESVPGEWTRFHMNLPLARCPVPISKPRPRLAPITRLSVAS